MSGETGAAADQRWSVDRISGWWNREPWWVGCNFIPSSAINQLEMWQAASFDAATLERELGWAADLGFNACRVYLHDLLWEEDAPGFCERMDHFLDLAAARGLRIGFVLFDDVWNPEPRLGPQPAPYPGRHNSGWVGGPGLSALIAYPGDPALRARLERYVKGVLSAFGEDDRVGLWDIYNEPGGYPSPGSEPVGAACLPLLSDAFHWARSISPQQPLTSGLWQSPAGALPPEIGQIQLAHSDLVTFHHYGPPDALRQFCEALRIEHERPLLCTEYLARPMKSRFETHLPIFQELDIGAIHWGFVSGKTQTIYPWWSWFDEEPQPEPEVWFHDILRPDGTPYDPAEAAFVREFLATSVPGSAK